MEYTQDRLIRQAREAIVATNLASDAQIELVAPKPNIPADLAFPTFKAARDRQMPPPQLASELAGQISFGADSLLATSTAVVVISAVPVRVVGPTRSLIWSVSVALVAVAMI
jgi:arginyl-tRNA synthetase